MTNTRFKTLQSLVLLSAAVLTFSSCIKDECTQYYTYKLFKPVYMSYDELRQSVNSEAVRELRNTGKIYYKQPYLFVNEIDKGIHVFDNSNPSAPQKVGFINIPGNLDIAISDNTLYADSYIDFVAIDITNPLSVTELWRDEDVFPQRNYNGWFADGTQGVVTGWIESDTTMVQSCNAYWGVWLMMEDGMATANNSTGGGTSSSGTTPGIGVSGSMARFAIDNTFLYCLNAGTMNLYDISNAAEPVAGAVVTMPWNVETLFAYNQYLFVGTTTGVSIYNNSNPSSPSLLSTVTHVTGCDPVVVQGNYAYSTIHAGNMCGQNANEINVIDISNIANPQTAATYDLHSPYGLGIDGNYLFVCDDSDGLKMYDVSDPEVLVLKESVAAGNTRDVIPLGGLLIMVSTTGIYQFDYSSGSLQELSFIQVSSD